MTWNPDTGGDTAPPRTYCTDHSHGNGEHSAACMPPAGPGNPELLRDTWIVIVAVLVFLACLAVIGFTIVIMAGS